jgi:hypothetical protein
MPFTQAAVKLVPLNGDMIRADTNVPNLRRISILVPSSIKRIQSKTRDTRQRATRQVYYTQQKTKGAEWIIW